MKPRRPLVMYHGERDNHLGKIHQLFKDKRGKVYLFRGIRAWFGEVYRLEAPDRILRRPTAIESDWKPTEAEEREYHSQVLIVKNMRMQNRKAMKLKRPPDDLVTSVNLFRPYYLGLNEIDRRRLLGWFANECSKRRGRRK